MNEREALARAFDELEKVAVHPSAQEIAETMEGLGSPFSQAEVRAHAGWCEACRKIAGEFEGFEAAAPASNRDWEAMQRRLGSRRAGGGGAAIPWWLAAAAGFAACGLAGWFWLATRPQAEPVMVERRVEVAAPVRIGNAAVVDLMPLSTRERGGGPTEAAGAKLPDPLPGVVTFILNAAPADGDEVQAIVADESGREVWRGSLKRQSGVFTFALGAAELRGGPLTVELQSGRPGRAIRYRIGR